jgi:hypothetical protein
MNSTTSNALMIADGFDDDAQDPTASPLRGPEYRFKDGGYFHFADRVDVSNPRAVLDKQHGWQLLKKGCPPQYRMRKAGEPKPERPHVDEKDWPKNLNGVPEHPWRYTTFLLMLDTVTGETSTFSTNTVGGNIAVGELSDQIGLMRRMRPDAIPVVALESRDMPTQFGGKKPRPYFRILGWRGRSNAHATEALPAPHSLDNYVELERPSLADEMADEIPTFEDR